MSALTKYKRLSRVRIAELNGIRVQHLDKNEMNVNPDLRSKFLKYPGGFSQRMTEGEAFEILNIKSDEIMNLTKDLLKKKHRQCMIANHPDKGGSVYLSMKINEAKDILERSYMFKR